MWLPHPRQLFFLENKALWNQIRTEGHRVSKVEKTVDEASLGQPHSPGGCLPQVTCLSGLPRPPTACPSTCTLTSASTSTGGPSGQALVAVLLHPAVPGLHDGDKLTRLVAGDIPALILDKAA